MLGLSMKCDYWRLQSCFQDLGVGPHDVPFILPQDVKLQIHPIYMHNIRIYIYVITVVFGGTQEILGDM